MDYSTQLRSVLRAARAGDQLERHPLGLRLRDASNAPSVRAALLAIGERAFCELGERYALHRDVLLEFTIRQNLSREDAAKRSGISLRRFFYVYAQSLGILQREVQRLLEADERTDATRLVESLFENDPQRARGIVTSLPHVERARFVMQELHAAVITSSSDEPAPSIPDEVLGTARATAGAVCAWALELRGRREEALRELQRAENVRYDHLGRIDLHAQTALVHARTAIARHNGDASALAAIAANARSDDTAALEAALAAGDLIRARGAVERARSASVEWPAVRATASIALNDARIELLSGNWEEAQTRAALLADLAHPHGDIRDMARIVCARAAALQRRRIDDQPARWHGEWYRLYYAAILARSRREAAEAEAVFTLSLARGYLGTAAHASATIAWLRDDLAGAGDAWRLWVRGRHFDQGFDVMPLQLGTALLHEPAMRALIAILANAECADWPVHPLICDESAADRFWHTVLHAASGASSMRTIEPMIAGLIAATASPSANTMADAGSGSARRLAKCISLAIPYEKRHEFIRRFTEAIATCNARALRSFRQTRARIVLKAAM